ncbi:MAG: cytidylate kinase family protein [archaeon]|nr:cytidylate kinase family protein [archaeon]
MKKSDRVVIVSGFAGTGKSTIVEAVSKAFKMKKVFTSGVLKNLLLKENNAFSKFAKNEGFWESAGGKKLMKQRAKDSSADRKLDNELFRIIAKGNVVMDSWTMGYLSKKGFKIWLFAPIEVSAKRMSLRNKMPYKKLLKYVKAKNNKTTKIYEKLYGFSLGENLEKFDLVINTANFSEKEMKKVVVQIVRSYFDGRWGI